MMGELEPRVITSKVLIKLFQELMKFFSAYGIDAAAWTNPYFLLKNYYYTPCWYELRMDTGRHFRRKKHRTILYFREAEGAWYAKFADDDLILFREALQSLWDDSIGITSQRADKRRIENETIEALLDI